MSTLQRAMMALPVLVTALTFSCKDVVWTNEDFTGIWQGTISVEGELNTCPYDAGDGKTPEMDIRHVITVHQPIGIFGDTVTVIDSKGREYNGSFVSDSQFGAGYTDPKGSGRNIGPYYQLRDPHTATLEQAYDVAWTNPCRTKYRGVMHKE